MPNTPVHIQQKLKSQRKAYHFTSSNGVHHCGHGVKRELPPYRHVRIWEMNCGEVRCSLSERDYFLPQFINEYIDAALDDKAKPGEWLALNKAEVYKAQKATAEARPR